MSDLLSQEEIDALLDGVEGGAVETGNDEPLPPDAVITYDFTQQDRIVRGRLPTLEMVNDRFARFFRSALFGVLRKTCEVSVLGVKMVKFAEYVHALTVPSNLNLVRIKPLRGTALVVMSRVWSSPSSIISLAAMVASMRVSKVVISRQLRTA